MIELDAPVLIGLTWLGVVAFVLNRQRLKTNKASCTSTELHVNAARSKADFGFSVVASMHF